MDCGRVVAPWIWIIGELGAPRNGTTLW
jgi:hypothetical protein